MFPDTCIVKCEFRFFTLLISYLPVSIHHKISPLVCGFIYFCPFLLQKEPRTEQLGTAGDHMKQHLLLIDTCSIFEWD